MCHVTERATSVRTAGARGRAVSEDRCWEVEEIGEGGRDRLRGSEKARETPTIDRGRSSDQIRGGDRGGTSRGASK